MKYVLKEVFEAFTFEEFIQYGIESGAELVDGVPWCFEFYGVYVTHATNQLYLVGRLEFSPVEMLVLRNNYDPAEEVYPFVMWDKETFMDLHTQSLASLQEKIREDMDKLLNKKGTK